MTIVACSMAIRAANRKIEMHVYPEIRAHEIEISPERKRRKIKTS
jgi:hypothetical protein